MTEFKFPPIKLPPPSPDILSTSPTVPSSCGKKCRNPLSSQNAHTATPRASPCAVAIARSPGAPNHVETQSFAPTPVVITQFHCDARKIGSINPEYCKKTSPDRCSSAPFTRGRIFFPKVDGVPGAGPIVVLCHGKPPSQVCPTPYYKGFDYLLKCLAANGMIAVAVDVSPSTDTKTRKDQLMNHLADIKQRIAEKGVALAGDEPLALVGHSNGGEAVAWAAKEIFDGKINSQFTWVDSVVQLAPTRTNEFAPEYSGVQYCTHNLVVMGAIDGNTSVQEGVAHYENFFNATMLSGMAKPGSFQSLVWIHGGNHQGLHDYGFALAFCVDYLVLDKSDPKITHSDDKKNMLIGKSMNFVVGAYVSGFLRMTLRSHPQFRSWFNGDVTPALSPPDDITLDDLNAKAKVETLSCAPSDSIMVCLNANGVVPSIGIMLQNITMSSIVDCPHGREGFRVSWNLAQNKDANITIPVPNLGIQTLVDRFVEFDVARFLGDTAPLPLRVSVTMPLNNGWYTTLVPVQQKLKTAGRKTMVLATVRVPMTAFPMVSVNSFKAVIVNFGLATQIGSMLMTSVRISP